MGLELSHGFNTCMCMLTWIELHKLGQVKLLDFELGFDWINAPVILLATLQNPLIIHFLIILYLISKTPFSLNKHYFLLQIFYCLKFFSFLESFSQSWYPSFFFTLSLFTKLKNTNPLNIKIINLKKERKTKKLMFLVFANQLYRLKREREKSYLGK